MNNEEMKAEIVRLRKLLALHAATESDVPKPLNEAMYSQFRGLGWCGCGNPEAVMSLSVDVLRLIHAHTETVQAWPALKFGRDARWSAEYERFTSAIRDRITCDKDVIVEVIYKVLDAAGWLEHGGVVCSSWLSEAGKALLSDIDANEEAKKWLANT